MHPLKKITTASVIGNALEMYDFTLYGIFSPLLAPLFFPKGNPTLSFLLTLSIFAVGFILRPLGGILFGHLGDSLGRKKALTLSIFFMAVPTFLIGILPTYEHIGLVAPLLLLICRLLQGVCAGGEYIGASIYIIEHYKKHSLTGFAGGLIASSGALGSLLAMALGFGLSQWDCSWGWRLPFILGGLVGLVGYYIRHHLDETPDFKAFKAINSYSHVPLKQSLTQAPLSILWAIGEGICQGALAFTVFVYLNIYFHKHLNMPLHQSMMINCISLLGYFIFVPLMGLVGDKWGHGKIMIMGAGVLILSLYPIFTLFNSSSLAHIIMGLILFNLAIALYIGPANAFLTTLFPVGHRYSGVAFGYGIGSALAGGTMPFISTLLIDITGEMMMPAVYLMGCTFVGLMAVYGAQYSPRRRPLPPGDEQSSLA